MSCYNSAPFWFPCWQPPAQLPGSWDTHWFAEQPFTANLSSSPPEWTLPAPFPPHTGVQVLQLLTGPTGPVQEALSRTPEEPSAEELEGLLEQLRHNSCGFCLLRPGPVHHGLRNLKLVCPQTDSGTLYLTPTCEASSDSRVAVAGSQPVGACMGLESITRPALRLEATGMLGAARTTQGGPGKFLSLGWQWLKDVVEKLSFSAFSTFSFLFLLFVMKSIKSANF